jgi:hypothetical protein
LPVLQKSKTDGKVIQGLHRHRHLLGLFALLGLTWLAYHPGLSGGFLFDDYNNLDALGNNGPVASWPVFWRYLTSGTADPLGRPLSLLSFLIDARDWLPEADFMDSHHPLRRGAAALTARLVAEIGFRGQ